MKMEKKNFYIKKNRGVSGIIGVIMALVALLLAVPMQAQKKEIAAAKDLVKAGNNLEQAQSSMQKLLADSANRTNKKIWVVLYEAIKKQYEQGNEKLYLKQAYDTAKLFNVTKQLFIVAQQFDSIDALPNKKGKAEIEYRKAHADYLSVIRPNLYRGGTWFIKKQNYKDAYQLFDQYLQCASHPLFSHYDYEQKDPLLAQAAYWSVYCGYKMQDAKATLHYAYEALKDQQHYDYMLQYLAETYRLEQDTARYVQILKEGFRHAPKFSFFFPRLVEFYADKNQLDSAMAVVDSALVIDPKNELYLYTKSTILLNQGKNKECIDICDGLLAQNDSLPEVYYNAGLAWFNQAVELDKNVQLSRKRRQEILDIYQKARPLLEKYRQMQPDMADKWSLPLYTIYLNLNMGKEFDEIDKLMHSKNKK